MEFAYLSWEAFAVLVTGILAVAAAWHVGKRQVSVQALQAEIAREQVQLERQNTQLAEFTLRSELFDRRYAYFELFLKYFHATQRPEPPSGELEMEFIRESRKADLFFPKEASPIITDLFVQAGEYQELNEKRQDLEGAERESAIAQRVEVRKRLLRTFAKFQEVAEKAMRLA